ncbi:MAG: hypothetical protein J6I64_01410 [Lachnospiraceae bacterium]|nr:hypothetical protein [Lachnospiraceae bacterium]
MRREEISDALQYLDDEIIEEVEQVRSRAKSPKRNWQRWGTVAACLCLVMTGMYFWQFGRLQQGEGLPSETQESGKHLLQDETQNVVGGLENQENGILPMLTLSDWQSGSMGYEGVLQYDAANINWDAPWIAEETPETMPVYRNGSYQEIGVPYGLTEEEIWNRLDAVAAALSWEVRELEYDRIGQSTDGDKVVDGDKVSDDYGLPVGTVLRITAQTAEGQIEAEADGTVTFFFEKGTDRDGEDGLPLPKPYSFTHCDTTDQQAEEVMDYLTDRFADLLDMEQPQKIRSGDYNIYGEMIRRYHVYEGSGDMVEDMLNYTFRYVQFAPNDAGELMLIRLYDGLLCSEKIGDYPIITAEEAGELLLAGCYFTSVPYPVAGEEYVAKVELVYRNSATEAVQIPYYRFWVEIPEMARDNGLKDFGAYYVPAVESQYIGNAEIYDGRFN